MRRFLGIILKILISSQNPDFFLVDLQRLAVAVLQEGIRSGLATKVSCLFCLVGPYLQEGNRSGLATKVSSSLFCLKRVSGGEPKDCMSTARNHRWSGSRRRKVRCKKKCTTLRISTSRADSRGDRKGGSVSERKRGRSEHLVFLTVFIEATCRARPKSVAHQLVQCISISVLQSYTLPSKRKKTNKKQMSRRILV